MSKVPGLNALHAVVTDTCRRNRTDVGAIDEALARIRKMAIECLEANRPGVGTDFHFVFTVDRKQ